MSKETRVWNSGEWVCLYVNDGANEATISLDCTEAHKLLQQIADSLKINPEHADDLRQSAVMIRRWIPEVFPANELGQVPFARAVMESVAEAIERALPRKE